MESPKPRQNNKSSKLKDKSNTYLRFYGVAFETVAFNIICIWGGIELNDRYSSSSNWILFTSIFFATAGTIYYLLKRINS